MIRDISPDLWLVPLEQLFSHMDRTYDQTARAYGFHCQGCDDNCCYTRFYHHTLLEYLYLHKGLDGLGPEQRQKTVEKARAVVSETQKAEQNGLSPRIMCPLNHEGLCTLYGFRPMICRLHGMAHELRKPGQSPVKSSGCGAFSDLTQAMDYIPFDRTPFYIEMVHLEKNLRQASGVRDRIRHTIAEMILL